MAAPLIRADGFVAPCIPSLAHKPSIGPDGVHEIKHDGYRLIVHREARPSACSRAEATTGPITIPESQRRPPNYGPSLSPGEAAVSGADGIAVFEALHRWRAVSDAFLRAFDLLELNGKDIRLLPLGEQD
jgi:bifunctional non-homologous end joining protein LigD